VPSAFRAIGPPDDQCSNLSSRLSPNAFNCLGDIRGPKVGIAAIVEREDRALSKIVEKSGEPETYLLLMDPTKGGTFQTAVKSERVTVSQEAAGSTTDRGEVGFQPGGARQFLLFPNR
jgi:hypothetical protein